MLVREQFETGGSGEQPVHAVGSLHNRIRLLLQDRPTELRPGEVSGGQTKRFVTLIEIFH